MVFAVFTNSGHGPDGGYRQEREPGHFEPELMHHMPEGLGSGSDRGQYRPPRPAALDHFEGRTVKQLGFSHHLAVDHIRSLYPVTIGRFYQRPGVQ